MAVPVTAGARVVSVKAFCEFGHPGPYLRVCQPGLLRAGDPIERLARHGNSLTVAEAMEACYRRDVEVVRRMTAVPGHNSRCDGVAEALLAAGRATTPTAG
jgi:MOSC domain-containing protein YiiM